MKESRQLDKLINAVKQDTDILAVFLFGSIAQGKGHKNSDIDICLIMKEGSYTSLDFSEKKMEYLKAFEADIQIFQQLPLYMRERVIQEGKQLFCRDEDSLYQLIFRTIAEFEDFADVYHDYLKEVESVR